jgi:xylan 1,4-beta-xylosidase
MHPDPSVCRVGRDAYLVTSSFEYFPGVPIFRSRNLVDWLQIGHVLTRPSQLDLTGVPSSGGIYAPTLRGHDGTFYLVTTHSGRGNFVVTASRPQGPWSDPTWLDEDGIDPSLAFLDGRVYYTRNGPGSDPDHPFVYQGELTASAAGLELSRRPRVIWKGTGGVWPEAPHLYRRGAHYYLLTAEGGTSYGHSVVVARSRRPFGPFEASPHGPLVTHRDRRRDPVQAVGHADLVELDDGTTWAVLLGIRVAGGRHHHLGRETFLAPVTWGDDGWPRMQPVRPTVSVPGTGPPPGQVAARDDFDTGRLSHSWMFVRNPDTRAWSLRQRPGYLRLWGSATTLSDLGSPALVCRRQQHFDVVARTRLEFEPLSDNEQAGLCVRASEEFHAALLVGRRGRRRELRLLRTLGGRTALVGHSDIGAGALTLEVAATKDAYVFRGGTGRRLDTLGSIPTRALSAETITRRTGRHHFTGCVFGLVATGNGRRSTAPADFDWFDYLPAT